MKINLRDTREITYNEYEEILILYRQQMIKTANLQDELTEMHNKCVTLQQMVDNLKRGSKKIV